jgi:hypothetical protein
MACADLPAAFLWHTNEAEESSNERQKDGVLRQCGHTNKGEAIGSECIKASKTMTEEPPQ